MDTTTAIHELQHMAERLRSKAQDELDMPRNTNRVRRAEREAMAAL